MSTRIIRYEAAKALYTRSLLNERLRCIHTGRQRRRATSANSVAANLHTERYVLALELWFCGVVILTQDSGFVFFSANYTYRFWRILYKEERKGRTTRVRSSKVEQGSVVEQGLLQGRARIGGYTRAKFIRTRVHRTALSLTNKASRILFVTALFISYRTLLTPRL